MARTWYGNLTNRLEEGNIYGASEIKEGMDITMYLWSDRHAYFVTKVVNQQNIFVREYDVCGDFETAGGMGHQNWKYFKSAKEIEAYLNKHGRGNPDSKRQDTIEQEWVIRYGKWQNVIRWTLETYEAVPQGRKWMLNLTAKDIEKLRAGKVVNKYNDLTGKVSFNVRDYYHDWEF